MAEAKTETAFVLPVEAANGSTEPVHFGGFPGLWSPGVPVAVSELGFATVTAAREALDALGLPLRETRVDIGSAPMPARDNHAPSEAEVRGTDWQPKRGEPGGPLEEGEGFPLPREAVGPIAPELSPIVTEGEGEQVEGGGAADTGGTGSTVAGNVLVTGGAVSDAPKTEGGEG